MIVSEGKAKIDIPDIFLSKKADIFYNPLMKINRDFTILVLKSIYDIYGKKLEILDSMAASGIRSIRIIKEIPEVVRRIVMVDIKDSSVRNIIKNLELNEIRSDIEVIKEDCRRIMYERKFDYIDIDPFGSPVGFIQPAVISLRRGGILGVTATDISALSGSRQRAGFRKYGIRGFKTDFYLEFGIRVLAKYVIEEGLRFDIAMVPIFAYYHKHHYRIFFKKSVKSRDIEYLSSNIDFVYYCKNCGYRSENERVCKICGNEMYMIGPIYKGNLYDLKVLEKMEENSKYIDLNKDERKVIDRIISCDSRVNVWHYYDIRKVARYLKIKEIPKIKRILEVNNACRTHFSDTGIKCYDYPNLKI